MIFLGHNFCQGYSLWQVNGTPKSHVTSNIFLNAKILVQNFKKRWFFKFFHAFLGLNSPLMIYLCPSFDQCYSPWRARGPPKRYFSSSTFFKQNFMFKILKNAIFGKLVRELTNFICYRRNSDIALALIQFPMEF